MWTWQPGVGALHSLLYSWNVISQQSMPMAPWASMWTWQSGIGTVPSVCSVAVSFIRTSFPVQLHCAGNYLSYVTETLRLCLLVLVLATCLLHIHVLWTRLIVFSGQPLITSACLYTKPLLFTHRLTFLPPDNCSNSIIDSVTHARRVVLHGFSVTMPSTMLLFGSYTSPRVPKDLCWRRYQK